MKRILLSKVALATMLLVGASARQAAYAQAADATKPIAVISLAGYDALVADINYVGTLAGQPGAAQGLEFMLQQVTQGKGLQGLDKKGPIGVVINTDGQEFKPLIFVPVTDLKQVFESLAAVIPGGVQDAGDSMFELQAGPQKVYAKQQGGWAFLAQSTEALATLPQDPSKLLGGLNTKYDAAVRINIQNIPELFRTLAVDQIKQGVETALERRPEDEDGDYELRKLMVERQVKQIEMVMNELEQITIGLSLDQKSKSASLEFNMTAVPGGKMAKQLATYGQSTTNFAGFLAPGAAVTVNLSGTSSKEEIDDALSMLKTLRARVLQELENNADLPSPEAKKAVGDVAGELFDVLVATVETGKSDMAAMLALDEKSLSLLAGTHLATPDKLEATLKKLNELGRNEPGFPGIKFDADKHGDVRLHTISVPVPSNEPVAKVFGEKLDVVIGIGKGEAYLAVGNDALSNLKTALDKSKSDAGKKVAPMKLDIAVGAIAKFVAAQDANNPGAGMISQLLEKSNGQDHVIIGVTPETNGATVRFELQEGVLQLIPQAAMLQRAGGGGPPPAIEFGN